MPFASNENSLYTRAYRAAITEKAFALCIPEQSTPAEIAILADGYARGLQDATLCSFQRIAQIYHGCGRPVPEGLRPYAG